MQVGVDVSELCERVTGVLDPDDEALSPKNNELAKKRLGLGFPNSTYIISEAGL